MTDDPREDERHQMVDRLVRSGRCERSSTEAALRAVPRHAFVPDGHAAEAHRDRPLPIGNGQTISAPHMVAMMLDRLALEPGERVLEVGTGCGYHAGVTAEVVGAGSVFTVEVDPELAREAEARLVDLGYDDVSVRVGDGRAGWSAHAPFDAVYLTCAAPSVPEAPLDQVVAGGRLLAPVGERVQELVLVRVAGDGTTRREHHGGVRFVPLREG